ncbi:hypothetical protein SAMN05444391_0434 [Thermocrinis minervae]|uniref:Uncharacterized protein n=2 Tax=Thermocrinis minervae TaxID=381751 RepID=A0A1M6QX31_9AQUI|nr:hypothetical protein SAMN05444391_0434 [Thermocrinis minervae]
MKHLDVNLVEELSNLEYFIVKSPVVSKDFWAEWQEKFSRAYMSRIAVKKILRNKKLTYEEANRYKTLLQMYEDVLTYLEMLKTLSLSLRGVYPSPQDRIEFDDEDIDFDL